MTDAANTTDPRSTTAIDVAALRKDVAEPNGSDVAAFWASLDVTPENLACYLNGFDSMRDALMSLMGTCTKLAQSHLALTAERETAVAPRALWDALLPYLGEAFLSDAAAGKLPGPPEVAAVAIIYALATFHCHAAEAEAAQLRAAVETLQTSLESALSTADTPCHYDHHGYCQEHNLQPADECWVKVARAALSAQPSAPAPRAAHGKAEKAQP